MSWSLCMRRAWYDLNPPDGHEKESDPFVELVMQKGLDHERDLLAAMGPYVEATGVDHTKALMAANTPLIYQGMIIDETLGVICQPDFLVLKDGAYRADDAKLALEADGKKEIAAQLGTYERVLGSSHRARALLSNDSVYELRDRDQRTADQFIKDMSALTATKERPVANYTASKCAACPYRRICVPEFERDENLGLNYFVDNRAQPELAKRGIRTLTDLSVASPDDLKDVPYLKKPERQRLAILQAQSLLNRTVLPIATPTKAIGTPIHFDVETWPFGSEGKGSVYLWGLLVPPYRVEDYRYVWSDESDGAGDVGGWIAFLDMVVQLRKDFPDACLIHYTAFELTQIRMYAKRYGMENDPVVQWLLEEEGSCFDIKDAVSDSLILPIHGYGLKAICKEPALVDFQWTLEESGSQWSVVRYADYLSCDDAAERKRIRQELLIYNRDDVRGTRALEVWLDRPALAPSVGAAQAQCAEALA